MKLITRPTAYVRHLPPVLLTNVLDSFLATPILP